MTIWRSVSDISSKSHAMVYFNSITVNGKLHSFELGIIEELVSTINPNNYRTELKELMTDEQYPVMYVFQSKMSDALCLEIFEEILVNVIFTPNKFDQLMSILKLNPERSRKIDCQMDPKQNSKSMFVELDESQNMSTSKNSAVSLPNLERKKGIKRPLDDPNPSNVSKLYFI